MLIKFSENQKKRRFLIIKICYYFYKKGELIKNMENIEKIVEDVNVIKENEKKVSEFIESKLSITGGLAEKYFGTDYITERNKVKKSHGREYVRNRYNKVCRNSIPESLNPTLRESYCK